MMFLDGMSCDFKDVFMGFLGAFIGFLDYFERISWDFMRFHGHSNESSWDLLEDMMGYPPEN